MIPFEDETRSMPNPPFSTAARAEIVNRTHRIVRAQALVMQEQRRRSRSLWVPLSICSVFLLLISYAVWSMLDGYDLTPNGVPDASDQMMLLLLWSVPVTALMLGMVWFRLNRNRTNGEVS